MIRRPIKFEYVPQSTLQNVVVFGNIGSGKSTTLNKLAHMIENKSGEIQNLFLSKNSAKSVTLKTEARTFQCFNLIDTQGFDDPTEDQNKLWTKVIRDMTSAHNIVTR